MKLEGIMPVWVTSNSKLQRVLDGTAEFDDLTINRCDMSDHWTKVGEAKVTIEEFYPEEQMRGAAADALRKQIKDKEAAHYKEMCELNERLQSLLAISYNGESDA